MGFPHILARLPRTSPKPIVTLSPPPLQPLNYSASPLHNQISPTDYIPTNNSPFVFLPYKPCHTPFPQKISFPGFYRPFHGNSVNGHLTEEEEEMISHQIRKQVTEDSAKICKLLSNLQEKSSVESALEKCGVEASPLLVLEVLKKLSNAGILALGFFRWAEKQKGFKYSTESYNALIDSLGKIKQFKLIWVLVGNMKNKGLLTKDTFVLIMRRYARGRKVDDAIDTFEKMEKYGFKVDLSDFNRFLDTLCKSRQVVKAHQVFDRMKKRRFVPDKKSYAILLEGYGQQQSLLKLDELCREMEEEGFEPDVVAYGIIMNAYCKARKLDRAMEKFCEMEGKGIGPSPHIFCILINGLGSEKRLGEALKFFEMSKATGVALEAPTYNAVVGSYCWSLKFDEAYRVVDEMRKFEVGPNSRTFDIILHHLIKAGKMQEAYSLFQKMSREEGCEPTVSTYEIIVRMFCNTGKIDMAVRVWDQMKMKGILSGMHMFATMINSLCHENKLEDACKYFQEMLDLGIRPPGSVFSNLKRALLDEGKKEMVLDLNRKLEAIRTNPLIV